MNYKIETEVFPGTDAMIQNDMMGRATIKIVCDDMIIAELRDIFIRKTSAGKLFVAFPSQKDRNGKKNDKGKDIYYPYYKMFPENNEMYEKLSARIIEKLSNATQGGSGAKQSAPSKAPTLSPAKPMTVPAASATDEFDFS